MDIFRIYATALPLKTIGEVIIIIGLASLAIASVYFFARVKGKDRAPQFYRVFTLLAILIVVGAPFYFLGTSGAPGIVMIQNGELTVSGGHIGNNTYSTGDISYAFVENINSGNISLSSRTIGTSYGNIHEGQFRLSNGANAHVISNNATNLVILLKSGLYIILGSNDTKQLATDFSSNVLPVNGY